MISENYSKSRAFLSAKKLNAIVLINTSLNKLDPNINYFIGKTFEYCALILKSAKTILIVPELEYGRALSLNNKDMRINIIKQRNLPELLKSLKLHGRVGINYDYISVKEFNEMKKKLESSIAFVDVSALLTELRIQKSADELADIRIAAELTDEILSKLFIKLETNNKTKLFLTELDIMNYLELETKKLGLKTSFKPIVASGKNSANPHHDSKDKLAKGFCIIDFGLKYKGYCSDITRTIYFGVPSKKETELYNLVLNANIQSIEFCGLNKKCSEIHAHCKILLGKHAKYFIHGLGHGIGVEIHEGPTLNDKSKDILKDHMVFTIEPGIYLRKRFGIRIEDDIILLGNKKEVITKTTKDLLVFNI